jgi:hypothetical protein
MSLTRSHSVFNSVAQLEEVKMDSVKLKAVVMWCFNKEPNEMSGKWQMDLTQLSDAAVEALEAMQIEVKEKEGMGKYITCKSARPIKVLDTDGDEIEEKIGNGSKAKCIIGSYEWKYKNKKGVSPSLQKIVITELVEFGGGGGGKIDDDEAL